MVKLWEPGQRGDMSDLPSLQPLPTAAERAADVIRENIFEGRFAPGTPLPEAALSAALQISRNTVREAFRTLTAEHLLIHEPHKGVMVRELTMDDVHDIYRLRRMFELSAFDLAIETQQKLDVAEIGGDRGGGRVPGPGRAVAGGRDREPEVPRGDRRHPPQRPDHRRCSAA